MKTIKTTKSNWINNDEVEVTVKDNSFEFAGSKFTFEFQHNAYVGDYVDIYSPDWEEKVATGIYLEWDRTWEVRCAITGLARTDECPFTAALKVFCNVL